MKKLKPPSTEHSVVVENREKDGLLYRAMIPVRGKIVGRRIPEILAAIGSEEIIDDRWPDANGGSMTKMEAVMRVVFDMALEGDRWCIDFIANRLEGKPASAPAPVDAGRDVRDIPTDQLLALLGDQQAEIERQVNDRLLALGLGPVE